MCIRDSEYAVENLVRMFVDPTIGMVGAQKTLPELPTHITGCLLYTSDAADERSSVDLGGRRIIKKKKIRKTLVWTKLPT